MSKARTGRSRSPRETVADWLREAGLPTDRFIKVRAGSKKGAEEWRDPTNQYEPDDPELRSHVEQGGNVGIVCGRGLVVVDVDDREAAPDAVDDFPETPAVESGGGGTHLYLRSEWTDTKRPEWGDIQAEGAQVVCPGSGHPSGGTYTIDVPGPIAAVPPETIGALLDDSGGTDMSDGPPQTAAGPSQPVRADGSRAPTGSEGGSIGSSGHGVETTRGTTSATHSTHTTAAAPTGLETDPDVVDPREVLDVENDVGLTLREVRAFSRKLDQCLTTETLDEHPTPSETDLATVDLLMMYRFDRNAIERVLLSFRRAQDRHVVDDYLPRTIGNADPDPPVPGPLLRELVTQADRVDRPKVGRDTIVEVSRAVEGLDQPFTTTDVVDSGMINHDGASRDGVMKRVRRALKLLSDEYVRMGKESGTYQCVRTAEFAEVVDYARRVG